MGHPRAFFSEGKTTYWVNGVRFTNDTGLRNGKQKAIDYCLSNFIDPSSVITFDSILECDRYEYLLQQQKEGKISNLRHHQSLPLIKEYINYNGDTIPELRYNADFVYVENGKNIVEDVKGASLFQDTRFEAIKQIFDYVYREKAYIKIVIFRDKMWVEWKMGDRKKPQKLIKKQSLKIKELNKQLHQRQIEENKKQREIKRINELREKESLSKTQRERLEELIAKYKI